MPNLSSVSNVLGAVGRKAVSFIPRARGQVGVPVSQTATTQTLFLGGGAQQLKLGDEPAIIGRADGSALKVDHTGISRQHAQLKKTENGLAVRDMGSTNGTYVDGEMLTGGRWVELGPDSQISLGGRPEHIISLDGQTRREVDPGMVGRQRNGQDIPLPKEGSELVWGRDSGLPDSETTVSRKHLAIRKNVGKYWVKDLGSTNGTYLGDSKQPLKPGEWFEVKDGSVRLGDAKLDLVPKLALPSPDQFDAARVAPFPSLTALSGSESESILQRAQVSPSPEGRSFGVPDLTPSFLKANGFQPQQSISVGGSKIHVSKPYRYDGRTCVVGYVEDKEGKVHVRSMYRSGSHGLWKVASHAGQDGWFGKGESQESILLPLEAQEALSKQSSSGEDSPLAKQLFYGPLALGGMMSPKEFSKDLRLEHLELPKAARDKYTVPEEMVLERPQDNPDFSKPTRSFTLQTEVQGEVKASVVPSRDGQKNYMFCQDKEGRAWVGGVFPASSEVNSFGVNKTWIHGGPLTSPALDYAGSQRSDFAKGHVQGNYFDYSPYTNKLPVVVEFLQSQQK